MNLPDGLVYASAGTLLTGGVWVAREFVRDTVRRDRGKKPQGESEESPTEWTVRDFRMLGDLLIERFNGRYMLAVELRATLKALEERVEDQFQRGSKRFADLDEKLDALHEYMQSFERVLHSKRANGSAE